MKHILNIEIKTMTGTVLRKLVVNGDETDADDPAYMANIIAQEILDSFDAEEG